MTKKFFAHICNDGGDHYYLQFKAKKRPVSNEEWKPILEEYFGAGEGELAFEGPGLCGTYLELQHCEEFTL